MEVIKIFENKSIKEIENLEDNYDIDDVGQQI